MIRFDSKTQIFISNDISSDVSKILQDENANNLGVIMDEKIKDLDEIKKLIRNLKNKITIHVKNVKAIEPTTELVNEVSLWFNQRSKIDFLIGIGGGSIIDLSKAVSIMLVNPGRVEEYHGTGKMFNNAVRKMMIPTTAGTGSEVTPGAVLVNEKTKFKRALGPVYPEFAVLSAGLTISLPDKITASTGMDALAHAIESYTAKNANTITRMYSKEAFNLVFNNLSKVFANRNNVAFRENILLGASLAGYAIYNSNTGACHSLSYPLGIYHKIPHGIAAALILSMVVEINIEKGCYLYSDLYDLIEGRDVGINDPLEKSILFLELLKKYRPLGYLKTTLRDFGVDESNYEFLAERGLDLKPALSNNPVDFTLEDSKRVFKQLI